MDSQRNSGSELLLETPNSHLSGPHKPLRSNSNVDAVICERFLRSLCKTMLHFVVQNDAVLCESEEVGLLSAGAGQLGSRVLAPG